MTRPPADIAWLTAITVAVAVASAGGAALLRRYALARGMIDVPGRRSSHTVPTPRGGGLAGVLAWLMAVAVFWAWLGLDEAWAGALLLGGGTCLAAGWLEDRRGLPIGARLGLHALAALAALWLAGGPPALELGGPSLEAWPWGWALAVVGLCWFVNLFNFMDGIDGIASLQAICGGGALGLMLALGGMWPPAFCAWALAAAAAGFLLLNRPPAKIFMGDAGSYGLGFGLAALGLLAVVKGGAPLTAVIILQMAFLFDATLTLLRRLLRGEAVHRAHREHYYQRAVRAGLSHGQVDLAVLAINAALIGLALAVYFRPGLWPPALALALAIVGAACWAVTRLERRAASPPADPDWSADSAR